MSKIVIDRSVVERALDAWTRGCPPDCKDGMTDSGGVYPWGEPVLIRCPACRAFDALRAALEQPQVEQETKSYKVTGKTGEFCVFHSTEVKRGDMVYTHPQPPRQPLTEEQIKAIHATINWHEMGSAIAFARAVEAAHGIRGEA